MVVDALVVHRRELDSQVEFSETYYPTAQAMAVRVDDGAATLTDMANRRVGVVTGGAGGELKRAAAEGVDTFVTGEGPHWTYALAEELGVNVLYGGHYATETFGVKALAEHLSRRFKVPWIFVDHPTGL